MCQAGATLHRGAQASSLSRPLLLRSTGSRRAGSVVVAHGPSRSAACGIFPDQGSNPCPLHWQADSQPLCHQGSPCREFLDGMTGGSVSERCGRPRRASTVCGHLLADCLWWSQEWRERGTHLESVHNWRFSVCGGLFLEH